MSVNFRELIPTNLDDIKQPKVLPEGTYHGVIKAYEFDDKNKNKNPYLRFHFALQSAGEDISPEYMQDIDLSTRKLSVDFYLTSEASLWRLKQFIASLGLGPHLEEILPDTIGQSVVIYVNHQPNLQDKDAPPRVNVKNVKGEA